MMLEAAVLAPVLAQPSLPLLRPSGMHIAPDELRQVRQRLDDEDLTVLGYRFESASVCPAARFHAYQQALGGSLDRGPLDRRELAAIIARDIPPGSYVNLGIGQPTTVAEYLTPDANVVLHTENGMLGMGAQAVGDAIDRT